MKRQLIILAAAATLLSACKTTENTKQSRRENRGMEQSVTRNSVEHINRVVKNTADISNAATNVVNSQNN